MKEIIDTVWNASASAVLEAVTPPAWIFWIVGIFMAIVTIITFVIIVKVAIMVFKS